MLAFIRFLFAGLLLVISHAFAAMVQDEHGTFTLEKTPQRIVVLELSFADALAAVDVSPIGIADDNDAKRILPEVRAHLKPWQSVGTRAQPGTEAIAALKPDLIIADSSRHAGFTSPCSKSRRYCCLSPATKPTLKICNLRLSSAKWWVKSERCRHVWNNIKRGWRSGPASFPKGHAWPLAHHANSNSTCILRRLDRQRAGLSGAERSRCDGGCVHAVHRLEQLLAVNPARLLVAHYREESIVKRWQQDPLWQMLTAAQKQQVASVDSNTRARMRGIFAAERIAADTVKIFHHQPLTVVK